VADASGTCSISSPCAGTGAEDAAGQPWVNGRPVDKGWTGRLREESAAATRWLHRHAPQAFRMTQHPGPFLRSEAPAATASMPSQRRTVFTTRLWLIHFSGEGPSSLLSTAPVVPVLSYSGQRHHQPSCCGTPCSPSAGSSFLRLRSILDSNFRLFKCTVPRHSTWWGAPWVAPTCSTTVQLPLRVETTNAARRRDATGTPERAFTIGASPYSGLNS
jgi:hypothetical protein